MRREDVATMVADARAHKYEIEPKVGPNIDIDAYLKYKALLSVGRLILLLIRLGVKIDRVGGTQAREYLHRMKR